MSEWEQLEFDEPDDLCCEHAEEVDCDCEAGDDCPLCHGTGWYVGEHCCVCGGSPYCLCCRTCGASCVGDCSCPIAVQLEGGGELVL